MPSHKAKGKIPSVKAGDRIYVGPTSAAAVVCGELDWPDDPFGKRYCVVCKTGQDVKDRFGSTIGEVLQVIVSWNGRGWMFTDMGTTVTEAMNWLKPFVDRIERRGEGL
jgi:hypothetical protein